MAEKMRAQYLYRPPRPVVSMQDKIQTARKELEERGAEVDVAGMRRARNVDRWTAGHCYIIDIIMGRRAKSLRPKR